MPSFPPELQSRLALAIHAYADSRGDTSDATLAAVMELACRQAHERGMLPEAMVIALRDACDSLTPPARLTDERVRHAYDHLVSGCLKRYFEPHRVEGE